MIPVDDAMYIKTQIEGVPVDCLVDSGSRCSVVSTEIYAMLKRKNLIKSEPVYDELTANGVTGRKVECYGYVSLPVELGTLKFDANFWIMDMVPNLIIGLDICRRQGIKLDIPNNRLEIQRRVICLLNVETPAGSAKLRLEMALIRRDQKEKQQKEQLNKGGEKRARPQKPTPPVKVVKPQAMAVVLKGETGHDEFLKVITEKQLS